MCTGWTVGILSVLGFALWLVADLPPLSRRSWTWGVGTFGGLLLAAAFTGTTRCAQPRPLAWGWRALGGFLLVVGMGLLIYSVFVEIPLRQRHRNLNGSREVLITEGTYALCRHPGALWLALFLVGWALWWPAGQVVMVALLWGLLEWVLITVQDRWIFPQRFPEYNRYRERTPFLIPTRQSLRAAWASRWSHPRRGSR